MASPTPDFARASTQATGPRTKQRVDFPLEFGRVDYLRQIYLNTGAALLTVHQHVKQNVKQHKERSASVGSAASAMSATSGLEDEEGEEEGEGGEEGEKVEHGGGEDHNVLAQAVNGLRLSSLSKILQKITHNPREDLLSYEESLRLRFEAEQLDAKRRNKKSKAKKQKKAKSTKKGRALTKHVEQYAHRLAGWSAALDRAQSWVIDRCTQVQNLSALIESTEFGVIGGSGPSGASLFEPPDALTDGQVKREFERSVDLLMVIGEKFENTTWTLSNVQLLRTQFVRQASYRRERIKAEKKAARIAAGGKEDADEGNDKAGPSTNDDGTLQFDYRYDFDRHGILWYLGRREGSQKVKWSGGGDGEAGDEEEADADEDESNLWENPADSGRVKAIRSSKGAGAVNDICGRTAQYSCTDYREPKQYMGVDLGKYWRVYPSSYTLRHGSTQGILALRDWNIEGSHDGRKWFPLRKHRADVELPRTPYSTHTWKIEQKMQRKCRMIRIIQMRPVDMTERLASGKEHATSGLPDVGSGRHHQHPQHHALFLSGLEIYGKLVEV